MILFCVGVSPPPLSAITMMEEEKLGEQFIQMVNKQYRIIKDPAIVGCVETIGKHIVAALPPQPFEFHFYVIEEDSFNAFAGPAGHVFIHSGLLAALGNASELAGILSHEIAHVTCRHISQNIDKSTKLNVASLAGLAAGILLGIGGSAEAAQAVMVGSIAGVQSAQLAYTREMEIQADKFAVSYMVESGFDVNGLYSALKIIRSKDWVQIPVYLSTHPTIESRISTLGAWLDRHPSTESELPSVFEQAFTLARIKTIALYSNEKNARHFFKQALQKNTDSVIIHYGYGLVLQRTGQYAQAEDQFKKALLKDVFNMHVLSALGKTYFDMGRYVEAAWVLVPASEMMQDDPEVQLYYAAAMLKEGRLNEAERVLEDLLHKRLLPKLFAQPHEKGNGKPPETRSKKPPDTRRVPKSEPIIAKAAFYMAKLRNGQNQKGEVHFYLGIHYYELRNMSSAGYHLRKALALSKDTEQKRQIERMLAGIDGVLKRSVPNRRRRSS